MNIQEIEDNPSFSYQILGIILLGMIALVSYFVDLMTSIIRIDVKNKKYLIKLLSIS